VTCFLDNVKKRRFLRPALTVVVLCAAHYSFAASAGQTRSTAGSSKPALDVQPLNIGDIVKITFPEASNLDSTQQIRRDGRINLPEIGEVTAAGKMPAQLQKELLAAYGSKRVLKEITMTVIKEPRENRLVPGHPK
jgi:protein involved in polysaccharide export with SLBB domain